MVSSELILIAFLYLAIGSFYLVIAPAGLYFYLNKRWYVASSIERTLMYSLVFLFFPGLLLLAPILNLRPSRRSI
jgi:NAD(P)H-quinone oxidoreductase subunit L